MCRSCDLDLSAECHDTPGHNDSRGGIIVPLSGPPPAHDPVNHPSHYTGHPSGVECITVTQHMNFCRGNAIKYIWRAGEKGDEVEDLEKARWYITQEIERLKAA